MSIKFLFFLGVGGWVRFGGGGSANFIFMGAGIFSYSWKLPAYSGAFFLTVDNFSFFTYSWSSFAYSFSFFTYSWSFFAYSGKVRLIRALRDCKQRSSTVSKKAPTVSKKASPYFYGRGDFSESKDASESWLSQSFVVKFEG